MPTYNAKFSEGERLIYEGKYHTVLALERRDGEKKYLLTFKGKERWKSAALIDRDATSYERFQEQLDQIKDQ